MNNIVNPSASDFRFCPMCATALQWIARAEDGGEQSRNRCPACDWTHWNNPTPVLGAIVEVDGRVLLARNAAWEHRMFALITGFMEAGEAPEDGIRREILEETSLEAGTLELVGVYEHRKMNQVLIVYHAVARGEVKLSPELAEYRWFEKQDLRCWRSGTGYALADWLHKRGIEPQFLSPADADASLAR